MNPSRENITTTSSGALKTPAWKVIVQNVFGAAIRLHEYRDQRDTLLEQVILDHERAIRERRCCSE